MAIDAVRNLTVLSHVARAELGQEGERNNLVGGGLVVVIKNANLSSKALSAEELVRAQLPSLDCVESLLVEDNRRVSSARARNPRRLGWQRRRERLLMLWFVK